MTRLSSKVIAPAGLLAAICFQLAAPTFLHPAPGETLDKYGEVFLNQRGTIVRAAFFALLGGMLLVTFLGAFVGGYRRDAGQRPFLGITFGSGLVAVALFVVGRGILPLLAMQAASFEEFGVLAAVEETVWIVEVFVVPLFMVSMFAATSYVVSKSDGLARWIRWPAVAVGFLAGAMFVLIIIGIAIGPETWGDYQAADENPPFQPAGLAGGVIGPLALVIWAVVAGAAMIQDSRRRVDKANALTATN